MKKQNVKSTVKENLKNYNYINNKDLYNIMHAYEILKYYINFHGDNEELTEQLSEIIAELQAEDY